MEMDELYKNNRVDYWKSQLIGILDELILEKVPDVDWDLVHDYSYKYFIKYCTGKMWANHIAIIMIARSTFMRNNVETIVGCIRNMSNRLDQITEALKIESMELWDADTHLKKYMDAEILKEHSDNQRFTLLKTYNSSLRAVNNWVSTRFNEIDQQLMASFTLPVCNIALSISNQRSVVGEGQKKRKLETDAILPYYPEIRGESHFRWNLIHRIKTTYYDLINSFDSKTKLPFEFSISDEHLDELLHFRIWDRISFVMHPGHNYDSTSIIKAKKRIQNYSEKNNHLILEFVKAEKINSKSSIHTEGLWFYEIIKQGIIGQLPVSGSPENKKRCKKFLNSWGYGDPKSDSIPIPFDTKLKGLLSQGDFLSLNQNRCEGILINIDSLYAGATFGLAIVDIITTTGARLNELLQIKFSKDCIVVIEDDTQTKKSVRYVLRLIPKGRIEPEDYFIGEETLKNLIKVSNLLKEHYSTTEIPKVNYNYKRKELFPKSAPYAFQYNHVHFRNDTVSACLRFLLHGMVFKSIEGNTVVLKPHLLRHAFATHAVQVEKIPVDIVGQWLHQKNINITEYYSAPTTKILVQSSEEWLNSISSHIKVSEAIKRSPEEIIKMFEEAKLKVGTLNRVIGGVCSSHSFCPSKFQCIGCAAKIPEPDRKDEILKMKKWATDSANEWQQLGLLPEVNRMVQVIKECDKELYEIELMEAYRKDERYEPQIKIK